MNPMRQFCGRTRREFLWEIGGGFGAAALTGLLSADGFFNRAGAADLPKFVNPLAPKKPHFPAKAKSVIFIFCYGGPSHIETFDYKPKMYPLDGKTIEVKTFGRGGHRNQGRVVGPKWQFKQYGQCGKWVSDLFPNLATCVDDIAFVHSFYAESPIHGSAMLMMNSGRIPASAPVRRMVSAARTRTCPASSSCSTRPAAPSAARRTGRPATCRPRIRAW
jgi:Protein of unknown function (DUF1501)